MCIILKTKDDILNNTGIDVEETNIFYKIFEFKNNKLYSIIFDIYEPREIGKFLNSHNILTPLLDDKEEYYKDIGWHCFINLDMANNAYKRNNWAFNRSLKYVICSVKIKNMISHGVWIDDLTIYTIVAKKIKIINIIKEL